MRIGTLSNKTSHNPSDLPGDPWGGPEPGLATAGLNY